MSEEQSRWVGLSDCSWMNIVNHANCYAFHDKEEAVEMAVKLTEAKLKSLNDVARPCPRCAELEVECLTHHSRSAVASLVRERDLLAEELEAVTASNRAVEAALKDVQYKGTYADGVGFLKALVAELTKERDEAQSRCSEGSQELTRAEELIEEQLGTIKALNIALGGEESTSTENLIDAHDVDYNEEGLISLCRKLIAENVRLGDTVEFQKAGWASDYEQLTRAESLIDAGREAIIHMCNTLTATSTSKYDAVYVSGVLKAITEYREGK